MAIPALCKILDETVMRSDNQLRQKGYPFNHGVASQLEPFNGDYLPDGLPPAAYLKRIQKYGLRSAASAVIGLLYLQRLKMLFSR